MRRQEARPSRSSRALPQPPPCPRFAADRSGAEVVKAQCARCHEAGTANAPKPGDKSAWAPRMSRGIDALALSAMRGHGGMPPRGGKADLTDGEIRSAVLYLFDPTGATKPAAKAASAPAPAAAGLHRASAGGMDIYLGRLSAEQMRAFPAGSPEAKMHGGIPGGSGYWHVNVSVFDSASQAQVTGATVDFEYEQLGHGRARRRPSRPRRSSAARRATAPTCGSPRRPPTTSSCA